MSTFNIGLNALSVGQRGLDIVGQNLANANTPGYHRQSLAITGKVIAGIYPAGVEVSYIERAESRALRASLLVGNVEASRLATRLDSQRQAESLLNPGDGAVNGRLEQFFSQVGQLTLRPEDATQRRLVLSSAASLAGQFNTLAGDLDALRANVGSQVAQTVREVNEFSVRVADLNQRIAEIEVQGGRANDLKDQRDQLIVELSQRVEVRTIDQPHGVINVMGPGTALLVGDIPNSLSVTNDPSGNFVITSPDSSTPLKITGGKLGGLLAEYNQALPGYRARLDTLARSVMTALDGVQATGLGAGGPVTVAAGTRPVPSTSAPLSTLNLPLPPQAGTLAVSITNSATNERTLTNIAIDPATMSLQDVASAVTAGTGGQVQGIVETATNTLRFQAQSGYTFDFAGRLPTTPPSLNMNGTATPTVTGTYQGTTNDTYSFQVIGSGTVGTTPGLQLEVRNSANALLTTLNIGAGYTPGDGLAVGNGITVKLSAGTSNAGTFAVPVTGQPDTAGVLTSLGIGTMFSGVGATDMKLNPNLAADPTRLAVSRSGQPGDAQNLERLAALRDARIVGGTRTFGQDFADLAGTVGATVNELSSQQVMRESLQQGLFAQEQAVIGVDVNEEMVSLLQYQRMVEAATRYISVVNNSLDAVIQMVR